MNIKIQFINFFIVNSQNTYLSSTGCKNDKFFLFKKVFANYHQNTFITQRVKMSIIVVIGSMIVNDATDIIATDKQL